MRTRNPRFPRRRSAEMPRMHRGRRGRPGGRDRDSMRGRFSREEEPLLDLDSILEVDDEELELIEEDLGEEPMLDEPMGEEPGECPPGCAPVDDEEPAEDTEADEEAEANDDEEAAEEETEEEDDDTKEASVDDTPALSAKWAPLYTEADIQRLDKTADVVLVPFHDQQDPSYVVLANSRPVGEIRHSDLKAPDDVTPDAWRSLFVADAFPKGVVDAVENLGASAVLGDLGMRYFASQVTQRQADAAAKNQVQADLEENFQSRAAELKQNFLNNMLLAVEASNKNVFMQNALRDSVRKHFAGTGLPDATTVDLFENAMQDAGAQYFEAIVQKADEWLGFEKDAMQQVEATIRESSYTHPVDRGLPVEPEPMRERQASSVPVRTMQEQPSRREAEVSEWDQAELQVKDVLRGAGTINRGRR